MTSIVATDLDGTVMFSPRALRQATGAPGAPAHDLIEVDAYEGRAVGFMTMAGARRWRRLAEAGVVVPVTTRTAGQYLRLRLPGPPPRLAVVCNGARLLVDGVGDPGWERTVRRGIAGSASPFEVIWRTASTWPDRHGFATVRAVDTFFMYLTVRERAQWLTRFAEETATWAHTHGWRVSLQGRKLYLLPAALDKAVAVERVAQHVTAERVYAGGDSLLDAQMLRDAHAAIRPAHGELHHIGFTAPRCRTTAATGAAAGDEILTWYLERTQ